MKKLNEDFTDLKQEEALGAFFYGMGIDPDTKEPYVANPNKMAVDNRPFLDRWFSQLSEEARQQITGWADNPVTSWKDLPPQMQPTYKGEHSLSAPNDMHNQKIVSIPSIWPYHDPVETPKHYVTGTIEAVDYLEDNMPREAFIGGLEWNIKKYLHRWRYKNNPVEDLKKARWHLDRLIKKLEEQTVNNAFQLGTSNETGSNKG